MDLPDLVMILRSDGGNKPRAGISSNNPMSENTNHCSFQLIEGTVRWRLPSKIQYLNQRQRNVCRVRCDDYDESASSGLGCYQTLSQLCYSGQQ